MSDAAPADALYEFDCPLCDGGFEIESQWLGQTIPCPHCNGDVELPTAAELGVEAASAPQPVETRTEQAPEASKPVAPAQALTPTPSAQPPRKLSVQERAAVRRKVNLVLAFVGAVMLVVLFIVLAQFG